MFMHQYYRNFDLEKRDEELRPLHARYNQAKVQKNKVLMRDLEKQIKAVNDRYFFF